MSFLKLPNFDTIKPHDIDINMIKTELLIQLSELTSVVLMSCQ